MRGEAEFPPLANPFRYCGEYYDEESGLIYLRNRYYDPSIGAFINEDPIRDGLNWYVYCSCNPVAFVDPWGLKATLTGTDEYKKQTFDTMQLLTRDTLSYEIDYLGNWIVSYESVDGGRGYEIGSYIFEDQGYYFGFIQTQKKANGLDLNFSVDAIGVIHSHGSYNYTVEGMYHEFDFSSPDINNFKNKHKFLVTPAGAVKYAERGLTALDKSVTIGTTIVGCNNGVYIDITIDIPYRR